MFYNLLIFTIDRLNWSIHIALFLSTLIVLPSFDSSAQITVGTISNSNHAVDGYFLLAPTSSSDVYLLDNCGFEVHKWTTSSRPGLSTYLLEDGRLLRTGRKNNSIFNQGGVGGLVELYDWGGTLLWTYVFSDTSKTQHHDVEILPNGNILILATERINQSQCILNGRDPNKLADGEIWPEMLIEIEPIGLDSGRIVWEWHSWDHLIQDYDPTKLNYGLVNQHPGKLNLNYTNTITGKADWLHCNSVNYNPHLDQIILSARNFSEIWIIDHSTTSAQAATSSGGNMNQGGDILYRWGNPQTMNLPGQQVLFSQHDARWIADENPDSGKIMIFNNGDIIGYSAVDVIIPPTDLTGQYIGGTSYFDSTVHFWSYSDTSHFFGIRTSGAHQLKNGNVFICEGPKGRIFEIDSSKNIVFEYINPISSGSPVSQGTSFVSSNGVFRATKYDPDHPAFINRNLSPTNPIELNPNTAHCQLFNSYEELNLVTPLNWIFPNPAADIITIQGDIKSNEPIQIHNITGQMVYRAHNYSEPISVGFLPKGVYIVSTQHRQIGKFIKL